jgi:hypothetical protein
MTVRPGKPSYIEVEMRQTPWILAEPYRLQPPGYETSYGDGFGAFKIPYPKTGSNLLAIASNGKGALKEYGEEFAWDHVSVSTTNRCPNWEEMCFIKSLFWEDEETVIQFHPAASQYVDHHPYTLHLFRPLLFNIPLPPSIMIGPKP